MIELDFTLLTSAPELREPILFELNINTLTAIGLNLFNVSVLALILAYVLYKPIRNGLKKRTERIEGELAHAAKELRMKLKMPQKR